MKPIKMNAIAFAVAAAMASPFTMAADLPDLEGLLGLLSSGVDDVNGTVDGALPGDSLAPTPEEQTITYNNVTDVHLVKKLGVTKELHLKGTVNIKGDIDVNAAAIAVSDNKQIIGGDRDDAAINLLGIGINNIVGNVNVDNDAIVGDGAGNIESTGNTQLNSAAGDMNIQANDMSIAVANADWARVFGAADAEAFVYQKSEGNIGINVNVDNEAKVSKVKSTGNLHVNATAGNFNAQKNAFVAAVSSGRMAEATTYDKQELNRNVTINLGSSTEGSSTSITEVDTDFFNQGNSDSTTTTTYTPGTVNPVTNTASLGHLTLTGNTGINVSAGTNLLQSNKVAISHVNTETITGK